MHTYTCSACTHPRHMYVHTSHTPGMCTHVHTHVCTHIAHTRHVYTHAHTRAHMHACTEVHTHIHMRYAYDWQSCAPGHSWFSALLLPSCLCLALADQGPPWAAPTPVSPHLPRCPAQSGAWFVLSGTSVFEVMPMAFSLLLASSPSPPSLLTSPSSGHSLCRRHDRGGTWGRKGHGTFCTQGPREPIQFPP